MNKHIGILYIYYLFTLHFGVNLPRDYSLKLVFSNNININQDSKNNIINNNKYIKHSIETYDWSLL